jgi:hypothetical protein
MNTHTKKLFDRALDQAVPETWTQLSHEQMTELASVFAELIVRECADVGSKFSMAHPEDIRYQIKRHFGVEE